MNFWLSILTQVSLFVSSIRYAASRVNATPVQL